MIDLDPLDEHPIHQVPMSMAYTATSDRNTYDRCIYQALQHNGETEMLTGLGVSILLFGVRSVLNLHGEKYISRWWAVPAGLAGGLVGALFGTGGPPYVIYLSHRLRDKSELRATFSALFLLDGGLRIITFIIAGLLLQDGIFMALLGALPLMALGLYAGHRIHIGLSSSQMQRIIGGLLLISGASLLWNAWA